MRPGLEGVAYRVKAAFRSESRAAEDRRAVRRHVWVFPCAHEQGEMAYMPRVRDADIGFWTDGGKRVVVDHS